LAYLVIYFFSLYKLITLLEFTIFNLDKIKYVTDLSQLLDLDVRAFFAFNILEIGGFPPYNLFILKIIFIFFLIKNNFFAISCFFLLFTVVSLFYYLRLIKNLYYDLNAPFVFLMKGAHYNILTCFEYIIIFVLFNIEEILEHAKFDIKTITIALLN
jgi:NADH:ubiquinone oxidoreductase subunit 2 (subunit N)